MASHTIYAVSEEIRRNVCNLFYYFGYATRELKIPDTNTRIWFNYIQCSPEFDTSEYRIDRLYLEDISNRYKEGVTIFHNRNNRWDINQIKENWESWLF